jgi:hypothetical protein
MSGSRANSSAIQRRTSNAPNNVPPPGAARPIQGGRPPLHQSQGAPQYAKQPYPQQGYPPQQQGYPPQQQGYGYPPQQQGYQQQRYANVGPSIPPPQNPKMSVSDAIGLISLRLGRLETFIQQMPPLDQIALGGSSEGEIGENMRIVDEAVFTSIVSRLDRIEQAPKEPVLPDIQSKQMVNELKQSVDTVKSELGQLKELLLSLQSFSMQLNQKLVEVVFNQQKAVNESVSKEVFVEDDIESVDEEEEVDSEVLTGNIDLKSFVASNL